MRLLIGVALFFSFNTFATDWTTLETAKTYKLTQNFGLPQLGRVASSLEFSKGDEVTLNEIIPLDMLNVVLFDFHYENCPGSQMKTDMEIIPVQETSPVVEVGAQLEENCSLEIYVEAKDLDKKSLFE